MAAKGTIPAPAGALDAPAPKPQGPVQNDKGITAVRTPAAGPLVVENLGTKDAPDRALLDSKGVKINPMFVAPQSLAYFIAQNGYASRVENLDALGQSHNPSGSYNQRSYGIADVALGKKF